MHVPGPIGSKNVLSCWTCIGASIPLVHGRSVAGLIAVRVPEAVHSRLVFLVGPILAQHQRVSVEAKPYAQEQANPAIDFIL
jgi:hypothetical protein